MRQIAKVTFGCPIALEETEQMPLAPETGPDHGEESAEAMRPVRKIGQVAEQDID